MTTFGWDGGSKVHTRPPGLRQGTTVCVHTKYGHGAAVRLQTTNAIWHGIIGLWSRVAPFLSPWCGKKDVPTGVNLNQYAGSGSFIRWHSDKPFSLKFVCSKGPTSYESCHSFILMRLSLGWGGRGTPLCGPPLRRSQEHGGSAVRAALAASQSGSSVRCGASLLWHSRAQRHRSRRKRRAFLWGARSANGPPGLTLAPAECWAAPETAIQHVVPASAVTYASPAPVIEYATSDETAPVNTWRSHVMIPLQHQLQ